MASVQWIETWPAAKEASRSASAHPARFQGSGGPRHDRGGTDQWAPQRLSLERRDVPRVRASKARSHAGSWGDTANHYFTLKLDVRPGVSSVLTSRLCVLAPRAVQDADPSLGRSITRSAKPTLGRAFILVPIAAGRDENSPNGRGACPTRRSREPHHALREPPAQRARE